MKIKHWQGYGSVNATKIEKRDFGDRVLLSVKVSGNHEWGIIRDDAYDLTRWLISKFEKRFPVDYRYLRYTYEWVFGEPVDTVLYKFSYKKGDYDKCLS